MRIAQIDLERARARQAARRLRALELDIEGGDLAPALGGGDRHLVAHKPEIARGVLLRGERPARLRPAHHADHLDRSDALRCRTSGLILPSFRHETAIDDHEVAARKPRRREHPVAGSRHVAAQGRSAAIDQRLLSGQERGGEFDPAELVVCRIEARPARARGQIDRARRQALLERVDQRFLPGLALQLPGAEPNKGRERGQRKQRWQRPPGPPTPRRRSRHC